MYVYNHIEKKKLKLVYYLETKTYMDHKVIITVYTFFMI